MTVVGSAYVELKPLTTNFGAETEAAVKKAVAGVVGNIELDLDSAKLRTAVETAVAKATAGVEATVNTNVDSGALRTKVKAAAQAATTGVDGVQLDLFKVDPAELAAQVAAAKEVAKRAAAAGEQLELKFDVDFQVDELLGPSLRAAIAAAQASLDEIDVPVEADGDGLRGEVTRVTKAAEAGQKIKVPLEVDTDSSETAAEIAASFFAGQIVGSASRIIRNAGLAELFTAGAAGATAFSGALLAVASSLGSVVAAGAAVPSLLASIAQGFGVGAAALGGIGDALKAHEQSQKASTLATISGGVAQDTAARAAETAARSIRDATQSVTDAHVAAGRAAETSARRMTDAIEGVIDAERQGALEIATARRAVIDANRTLERSQEDLADTVERASERQIEASERVEDAQRSAVDAQEALSDARIDAVDHIDSLRDAVDRLSESETRARAKQEQARARQADINKRLQELIAVGATDPTIRVLKRYTEEEAKLREASQDAVLDAAEAESELERILKRQAKEQRELNEAVEEGIEGSEQVVTAKERVADAERAVARAIRDSADAARDNERAITDAQERVATSTERLALSQEALGRASETSARRISDAQERVSDAERLAADARVDSARRIRDANERLQDALTSATYAATTGTSAAAKAADTYEAALQKLAPSQRQFAEFLVELKPRIKDLQELAAGSFLPGLEEGIRRSLPVLEDFEPVIVETGEALGDLTIKLADLVTSPGFRADLIRIGKANVKILESLGDGFVNVVSGTRHLTAAGQPLAQHLADVVKNLTGVADASLEVARNDGRLTSFFDRVRNRIDTILRVTLLMGEGLRNVFSEASPSGDRYLSILERLSARFVLLTEKAKNNGDLRKFFDETQPAVEAIGRLVGDIASGLVRISTANLAGFTVFVDQIDQKLVPALEEVLSHLNAEFLGRLVDLAVAATNFFGAFISADNAAFGVIVSTLTELLNTITFLGTEIPIVSPLLVGLATSIAALGTAVAALKFASFLSEIGGLRAGVGVLEGFFGRMSGEVVVFDQRLAGGSARLDRYGNLIGIASTKTGELEPRTGRLTKAVDGLGRAFLIGTIIIGVREALEALAPSMDKAVAAIGSAKDPMAEFNKQLGDRNSPGVFDKITTGLKGVSDAATDFDIGSLLKKAVNPLAAAFENADKAVDELTTSQKQLFQETAEKYPAAALRYIQSLEAQGQEASGLRTILDGIIQSKAKQGIAEEEVSLKIAEATDVLKGNNLEMDRHIERVERATQSLLELSGAEIGSRDAFQRLTEAVVENGANFDINTEKGRENLRARNDLISALDREVQLQIEAAEKGELDVATKDRLITRLNELSQSSYPQVAEQAQGFLDRLNQIKPNYDINVTMNTDEATKKLQLLFSGEGWRASAFFDKVTPREFGGRVNARTAYIVGEKRPELFVPDVSGFIVPQVPQPQNILFPDLGKRLDNMRPTINVRSDSTRSLDVARDLSTAQSGNDLTWMTLMAQSRAYNKASEGVRSRYDEAGLVLHQEIHPSKGMDEVALARMSIDYASWELSRRGRGL